jgi:hypothetical protein
MNGIQQSFKEPSIKKVHRKCTRDHKEHRKNSNKKKEINSKR